MNFSLINQKNLPRFLLITLMCISLCSFGCSSMSAKKQTVLSYEVVGEVLKAAQPTLKSLCSNGILDAEECAEAKDAYNKAVDIYKIMGTVAIIAMDTGDQSAYQVLQVDLMELLTQISKFTERR